MKNKATPSSKNRPNLKRKNQSGVLEQEETEDQKKDGIYAIIKTRFWDVARDNSKQVSSICRQLAFAEGGICLVFLKVDQSFPTDIKIIFIFLILFFLADAAQYVSLFTKNSQRGKFYDEMVENGLLKNKEDVQKPHDVNALGYRYFWLKLLLILIASLLLIAGFYYSSTP